MKIGIIGIIAVPVALGLSLFSPTALAAPVTLVQAYSVAGNPNFREDLTNTLITATIKYDDGSLSGVGTELIAAESIALVFSDRALPGLTPGLNFTSSVQPDIFPYSSFNDFFANYIDGTYAHFASIDSGGALVRALMGGVAVNFGINLISFTPTGGQLSLATPNAPRYNTNVFGPPSLTVSTVPVPAALPLFLSALAGLGFFGWRRKRAAAVA